MKVSELIRQAAAPWTPPTSKPGPHWNPWPEDKPMTAPEALKHMGELAQHIMKTKIYPADVATKLQQIQVSVGKAMKGNKQGWDVAKEVYDKLSAHHQYLVPRVIIQLIHHH